jgi:hypothetical protein
MWTFDLGRVLFPTPGRAQPAVPVVSRAANIILYENYSMINDITSSNYKLNIIILLETYPCNSKSELESRERWWIENNSNVNRYAP